MSSKQSSQMNSNIFALCFEKQCTTTADQVKSYSFLRKIISIISSSQLDIILNPSIKSPSRANRNKSPDRPLCITIVGLQKLRRLDLVQIQLIHLHRYISHNTNNPSKNMQHTNKLTSSAATLTAAFFFTSAAAAC